MDLLRGDPNDLASGVKRARPSEGTLAPQPHWVQTVPCVHCGWGVQGGSETEVFGVMRDGGFFPELHLWANFSSK